jgi:hypothetical protein
MKNSCSSDVTLPLWIQINPNLRMISGSIEVCFTSVYRRVYHRIYAMYCFDDGTDLSKTFLLHWRSLVCWMCSLGNFSCFEHEKICREIFSRICREITREIVDNGSCESNHSSHGVKICGVRRDRTWSSELTARHYTDSATSLASVKNI